MTQDLRHHHLVGDSGNNPEQATLTKWAGGHITEEITHFRPLPGRGHLDPDVRVYFPDSESVNAALRGLIALIPAKRRVMRKPQAQEIPHA